MIRVSPFWRRLRLWALEAHDLALTKLERNTARDLQDVMHLARAGGIDAALPSYGHLLDPVAAYNRIAPVYTRLADQRRAFLDAVDRAVVAETPTGSRPLLDGGAGGWRSMLARRL